MLAVKRDLGGRSSAVDASHRRRVIEVSRGGTWVSCGVVLLRKKPQRTMVRHDLHDTLINEEVDVKKT